MKVRVWKIFYNLKQRNRNAGGGDGQKIRGNNQNMFLIKVPQITTIPMGRAEMILKPSPQSKGEKEQIKQI